MKKKHVSILAMKGANFASVLDAKAVFNKVNEVHRIQKKKDVFEVQIVGENDMLDLDAGLFTVKPDITVNNLPKTDLIIIPALNGDMLGTSYSNRFLVDWITKQYKHSAEIAALCTGAFMLAFTGLLKDKRCTTHWQYANEFRFYYPDVKLVDENLIVEQNGLYSSGGNNAYWNLLLYLIEKHVNRKMAILIAKYFVVSIDKIAQTTFTVFNGLKNHNDMKIIKAQEYIEHNFHMQLTVDSLAEMLFLTRRTFERRFKKCTHCSVLEYIQKVRIEASKEKLEVSTKPVDMIMGEVGYNDSQSFRELFKKVTGLTPVEYKKKYNL